MSLQRIALLVTALAVGSMAAPQPGQSTEPDAAASCATVVVQLYRGLVNAIDVDLPAGSDPRVAAESISRIEQHCGWQFDTPVTRQDGLPGARANAAGMYAVSFADLRQVAGILLALDTRDRVVIMFMPVEVGPDTGGTLGNRFVDILWRQSGGVRYYDITVKDQGFSSVEDLLTDDSAPRAPQKGDAPGRTPWGLLLLASLLVGAVAFFVSRAVILARASECGRAGAGRRH